MKRSYFIYAASVATGALIALAVLRLPAGRQPSSAVTGGKVLRSRPGESTVPWKPESGTC